ncbi:hypothetical protein FF100_11680 [Methylobacterium terricola]|uniref:Uncharacterized protein n=1 Tax=Methylobacterium terricola TaxID=2583531 RepID=A0A5C4LIN5_9HYPH|nr:hypothetical protein [Methylobacterium terricola]TNC13453.1 hypothetical protein FF100_11680 [Methylobacterium terricola]
MSAAITLEPVRIGIGNADSEGRLAYRGGRLVGVLTLLDADSYDELGLGRHWFLEAGFGPVAGEPRPPTFPTLDAARAWLDDRTARVRPHCAAAGHSPSAGWCGTGPAPRR